MTLPIDAAPVADLDHEDHRHVVLDDETHTIPPHAEGVEREIVVPLQFLEVLSRLRLVGKRIEFTLD
jgi:hypothetical protein